MTMTLRDQLAGHACVQQGLFTRGQALECGYTDGEIQRLVRQGAWRRLRPGVYIESRLWQRLSSDEHHLVEVRAALHRMAAPAVASHRTAARLLGLATHLADTDHLHLTRPDAGTPRTEAGIRHHAARLTPDDVVRVEEIPVTSPARTVADIGCIAPFESALVTADSAVHRGLDVADLRAQIRTHEQWAGSRNAEAVLHHVDGAAESPGETLSRVALMRLGLPKPELQVEFRLPDGTLMARVDLGWRGSWTVAEFDGERKYTRDLAFGDDPGEVVWREKKREDRLRSEFGLEVVRITWSDLYPDALPALRMRILDAFARAAARHHFELPSTLAA